MIPDLTTTQEILISAAVAWFGIQMFALALMVGLYGR